MGRIETDYLVVGAGAVGLAFADALVAVSDADVVLVDRRTEAGGHWNDAYPFVELHQPAANYGVNSRPLGHDTIDMVGRNAGGYERVHGAEVCAYFAAVLDDLLATSRVRFLGGHEHLGGADGTHEVVAPASGTTTSVRVRRAYVDATYLAGAIPATAPAPFTADDGAAVVTPTGLSDRAGSPGGYSVLGAGKTALDVVIWLLDQGVDPDAIRWVKPREAWLQNRRFFQPRDLVADTIDGLGRSLEAAAAARDPRELFERLEAEEQLLRVDATVEPTMYRGATINRAELDLLRQVTRVVRLGRVRHVGPRGIELDGGSVPTGPGHVHVDCTAAGIPNRPPRPIFEPDRITVQAVRTCQPTFNAALIGFVEGRGGSIADKNRLCPPNPYPTRAIDWIPNAEISQRAQFEWNQDAEISHWLERSRLNVGGGLGAHRDDPLIHAALTRYFEHAPAALDNLARLRRASAQAI